MVCSPANGYVAIPYGVWNTFISAMIVLSVAYVVYLFDAHVLRPGISLKHRHRDWE